MTLPDATVADITGYTKPAWATLATTDPVTITAVSTVTIRLVDLTGVAVALDATNVDLGTLTLTTKAAGSTGIVITPTAALGLQDRAGNIIASTSTDGTLTVNSETPALTASFVAAPNPVAVNTDVTFTSTVTGGTAPYTYAWAFGDGATSTDANPTHQYAAAGDYTVTLTVTDSAATPATATATPVVVTVTPVTTGPTITTGTFTANAGETVSVPITLSAVTNGLIGAEFTVTLSNAAVADITGFTNPAWATLTTTDPTPITAVSTVTIKLVDLTGTAVALDATNVPLGTLTLTAKAAGSTGIVVTPTATLGLQDRAGNIITATSTDGTLTVGGITEPLAASFTAVPNPVAVDTEVQFTSTVTGGHPGYTYAWAFGDGATSTDANPTHEYTAAGDYVVTLTVTDSDAHTATAAPVTITVTAPTGETEPFPGPHVPSAKIEAEDFDNGGEGVAYHDVEPANLGGAYRPSEGVDIEVGGSNFDVGWVRDGEYLKYSIDTTAAGDFLLTIRAANPDTTAKAIEVYLDGGDAGEVIIAGTGSFSAYQEFTGATPITIPTGRHVLTLEFDGINRINLDWLTLTAGEPQPENPATVPYGPGNNIPGRVQAENFDKSGTDPAFFDTTPANEGGAYRTSEAVDIEYNTAESSYDVGWIRSGEWLIYTVQVANAGDYTATFRAANPDSVSKPIDVYLDGSKVGTAQIGTTGSFDVFKDFTFPIALTTGTHQIKLLFPESRLNLNYIEFSTGGAPPSGDASFVAVPTTARHGSAFKFTVTPATGKTIQSVWWSFDAPAHLNTWNSRDTNPTFFYPTPGTYSPLVRLTYTDGTTEEVHRTNYITST